MAASSKAFRLLVPAQQTNVSQHLVRWRLAACQGAHAVSNFVSLATVTPILTFLTAPTGGSSPSGGAQRRSQSIQARPKQCQKGYEACPISGVFWGVVNARTYECVDTQNDLESCGGCVDNDSANGERNIKGGRDCSAIPNVDSVRCVRGQCVIGTLWRVCTLGCSSCFYFAERCTGGYAVAEDGLKCRPLFLKK